MKNITIPSNYDESWPSFWLSPYRFCSRIFSSSRRVLAFSNLSIAWLVAILAITGINGLFNSLMWIAHWNPLRNGATSSTTASSGRSGFMVRRYLPSPKPHTNVSLTHRRLRLHDCLRIETWQHCSEPHRLASLQHESARQFHHQSEWTSLDTSDLLIRFISRFLCVNLFALMMWWWQTHPYQYIGFTPLSIIEWNATFSATRIGW